MLEMDFAQTYSRKQYSMISKIITKSIPLIYLGCSRATHLHLCNWVCPLLEYQLNAFDRKVLLRFQLTIIKIRQDLRLTWVKENFFIVKL